jgi:hypothetical protein
MKQLLIVNSNKAIDAGLTSNAVTDLSALQEGAISLFELGALVSLAETAAKPATKNFGIALGKGTNKPALVIPEVDIDTLEIVHTLPYKGATFAASFTMPTTVVGKEYTIIMCKKGVVPNERNLFTVGIIAGTTTAATEAGKLRDAINAKTGEMFPFVGSGSSSTVTITCQVPGEDWEIKLVDGLSGVSTSSLTHGKKAIGDTEYMLNLIQQCAADKGFVYLDQASKDLYPGYPDKLEAVGEMNTSGSGDSSTVGYKIFSLHFATGRKAGKQVDERVWQYVHIAIPLTKADGSTAASALSALNTILPEGVFKAATAPKAATAAAPGSGYLTKDVADTLYNPI